MKLYLACFLTCFVMAEKHYNILSIDGGGIRGIIPATAIKNMESFAFSYATSKGYTFPEYTNKTTG